MQAGIAQLKAPNRNRQEQQETLKKAAESVQKLIAADAKQAPDAAKKTAESLRKLAKNIGSEQQRTALAKKELEQLRKQQQKISKQVAQKTAKKQPGCVSTKQKRNR